MKRVLVKSGIALLLLLFASLVPLTAAGTPCVAVYFDRALTRQYADCPIAPPGSVLDTLYVAVFGFSTPVEGIEFSIDFPQEVMYVADLEFSGGLRIGNTVEGVSVALFTPLEASNPVLLYEVLILWMCNGCTSVSFPIVPLPHPATGHLRAVTSDLVFEDVVGLTSLVCPFCTDDGPQPVAATARGVQRGSVSQMCILDCPAGDGGVIIPGEPPGEHHSPDLDGDGLVSIVDYSYFAMVYYLAPFDPDKDFYCSGNIDLKDFVLFTRHWQHSEITPVESTTWGNIKARYRN